MTDDQARAAARFLAAHAKLYGAGAFATPSANELANATWSMWDREDCGRTVAVFNRLTRSSVRRDWLGDEFVLGRGALVVTHLARDPAWATSVPPAVSAADYVFGYADDPGLAEALHATHDRVAVQISASSELRVCWGPPGQGRSYPPHDLVDVASWPLAVPPDALDELAGLAGWYDDYPFYSDGSWGALSLRGFYDDPTLGVKPSEMSKTWKAEHASDLDLECRWTTLVDRCPALAALAASVAPDGRLERVRLLRMAASGGKASHLARHSDITDKAAGTRDGQIVRYHVPLVTHPSTVMHTWGLDGVRASHHLSVGRRWYLDARKPHAVTNPSPVDRIHLTVDVVAGPDTRQELAQCPIPS